MLIVFDSLTGNVERFVDKINLRNIKITESLQVSEPFVLVTYTIGFGDIPESTKAFISNNQSYLVGVATSGNRIWGANFGKAGELISKQYNVPLLLKFELSGTKKDIELFKRKIDHFSKLTNAV